MIRVAIKFDNKLFKYTMKIYHYKLNNEIGFYYGYINYCSWQIQLISKITTIIINYEWKSI